MRISNISFGATFNTREVANLAGGSIASKKFLSEITGKTEENLTMNYGSDIYQACSSYAAGRIIEQHPSLNPIKKLAGIIKSKINEVPQTQEDFSEINHLSQKKSLLINTFCNNQGDTIEIEPFDIPFLK